MASVRNKLTAKVVETAKPKHGNKSHRIADGGGLYLHVRNNGSKNWEFRYQRPNTTKTTFMGLGSYPDLTLAKARTKATEYRISVNDGIDPQLLNAENKAKFSLAHSNTFEAIALQWIDAKKNHLKEKTIHDNWRKLELHAFPKIKDISVTHLTVPIAIAALRDLEKKGQLETVKRTAQLMNEIMTYAVNSGYILSNPLT